MKHFLITGAAGFIGSHLVNTLLDQGHQVKALDNFSSSRPENLKFIEQHPNKANFEFIEGDIRDSNTCNLACENIDYVLHQAAIGSVPRSMEEPALYHDNNNTGTVNMLLAAKKAGVKRFVYASSSSVYGDTPTLPKVESMPLRPKSPYALSKASNEYYANLYFNIYGLQTIGLRYFNVFGPRQNPHSQYAAVIPKFTTAFLKNEAPTIHGDGKQTRDFTYIDNVVLANINACYADDSACGAAYNIGGSQNIDLNKLVSHMKELLQSNIDPIYGNSRAGDVKNSLADINAAKTKLNYDCKIDIYKGLEKTLEWYKDEYKKNT